MPNDLLPQPFLMELLATALDHLITLLGAAAAGGPLPRQSLHYDLSLDDCLGLASLCPSCEGFTIAGSLDRYEYKGKEISVILWMTIVHHVQNFDDFLFLRHHNSQGDS